MSIQTPEEDERLTAVEQTERDESPLSEPPPTARWTPPPALIESIRPASPDDEVFTSSAR